VLERRDSKAGLTTRFEPTRDAAGRSAGRARKGFDWDAMDGLHTKQAASAGSSGPDVRYPPPVLFALGIVAGWLLSRAFPVPLVGATARSSTEGAGWLLVVLGTGLAGWGLATLRGARTSIRPNQPASTLVTHGPFRRSRNPMYLGLSLVYLGVALLMNSMWTALFFPFVIAALCLTVIRHEERYLAATFGHAYEDYRRRVRRWL
jgi:protein-S-isoprenylcysteine O-methyltransferase Ste14